MHGVAAALLRKSPIPGRLFTHCFESNFEPIALSRRFEPESNSMSSIYKAARELLEVLLAPSMEGKESTSELAV